MEESQPWPVDDFQKLKANHSRLKLKELIPKNDASI